MTSFKRYREPAATEKRNIFESGIAIDTSRFVELFSAAVAWSTVTQKRAGDIVVAGRDWFIDFDTGVLRFGGERFPFQVIGSESGVSNTWLWGWANGSIENREVLKLCDQLYALGESWNLEAFTEPQYELAQLYNGFNLSAVATMLADKPMCFYRCPHESGAVFVAFGLVPRNVFDPVGVETFIPTVMQLAQQAIADHRIMVESFLYFNGTPYERDENTVTAMFPAQPPLAITFDKYHRVTAIKGRKQE